MLFNNPVRTLAVAVFVIIALVVFCICAGFIVFGIGKPIAIYIIGGSMEAVLIYWITKEFWEQHRDDEEDKELANLKSLYLKTNITSGT